MFAEARLFVYFDGVAREGGRGWVVGGQGGEDAFCCFAGSAVGAGEEVEGVVGSEEGSELEAGFFCLDSLIRLDVREVVDLHPAYLLPPLWGEFDSVIWYGLVDITIFYTSNDKSVPINSDLWYICLSKGD